MKKTLIIAAIALGIVGCNGNKAVDHKDSVACAVFEGWPVIHDADFEIEAVFIPISELSIYDTGDTIYINDNGFVIFPIRDAESKQFITDGFQQVVIHQRVLPNKYKSIK